MGDENPIRTLGDYSKPSHEGYRNTIVLLIGNNVLPLRSDTIRLVQNGCSFHELRSEDPNQHLKDFLKLVDSLDLDGENKERTPSVLEMLNDVPVPKSTGNSMASKNIALISHIEREELRRNGIKSLSKLFSPKYISPTSIVKLNKNPSAPKRVHFRRRNSRNYRTVILKEVKEVIDEEESEVETDWKVEEILKYEEEEEEDQDGEYFNSFPTMEELTHHEWLLKNP
ncbi:hypothetical protein Tco_1530591 [Tanacetum coccineum]